MQFDRNWLKLNCRLLRSDFQLMANIHMVGYARIERAETIVELMPGVPKKRWILFVASLRLNKRLEFNQADFDLIPGCKY